MATLTQSDTVACAGDAGDCRADSHADEAFQSVRHARYFKAGVVYHVLCKTLQSFFLLAPDAKLQVRELVAGVVGKAQNNWPGVRLFAAAFLSNHFHLMLEGDPGAVVPFIAFLKREISRRLGARIGWLGPMWERYHATALLTAEAQARCFKYIIAQGVKEGLVARPEQWPGFHCAQVLLDERVTTGQWLNATCYGKAVHKEKTKQRPRHVAVTQFMESYPVTFTRLPIWSELSDSAYRERVRAIVDEVVREGAAVHARGAPARASGVCCADRMARGTVALPPWFTERRRMVVWDAPCAPEVKSYLDEYWAFQRAFREASDRWLAGDERAQFPIGAFRPGKPRPVQAPKLAA